MSNKVTKILEIDADISSLENKLKSMKDLMAGVLGSTQAPKGLEKSFEKIEGILDKIRAKAAQPLDSNAGFASIKKDITSAGAALNNVVKIVESINSLSEDTRISFLSPETQKEIQAIIDSLADFAEATAASTVETKELTEAREKLAKANASITATEQKLATLNADLDNTRQKRKAVDQEIAGIEERKKKLAELKKQQEEIEKFYNTPEADGSKKNRSKKYGDTMRPQDIRKKITDLESSMTGDEESLSRLKEELKKTTKTIDSYLGRIGTAETELLEAKRAQEQLAAAVNTAQQAFDSGAIEQQQKAFADLREKAKQLGISLEGISENYSPDDAEKLTAKFIELKNRGLNQVTSATAKFNQAAKETGEAVSGLTNKVDESAESFKNMSDVAREQEAFENKIKQFLGMAGAAQVLRSALKSAMDTIRELDATMTEMSVVTDLGVGDYWDQLPEYTKRANELGLAINDVYKADTLFYQQGLKTNEVVELSTETMKMAKIAGLDTAEATDRMTAALRGFNMELDKANAQKISDVYSELAAITAADVEEISSAMTKTASIASSAGMEFETTAAFLSQIIETTRESAETAGTAMKTVIARFQELKKAPDEIGEIDGEIVDANAIETALRSVGVSLRDAGGQFRELDDVFLELSSKWDTLDKNTQRYIATIAAGSRQQSRFIAMMSDYGRTQELVTAANNSAGASARQYEKTVDSLETKLNKLKNAWDEFAMGILESDLVKAGVEILTKFLEIINKATSAFDGLGGSIMKIMTVLMVFKLGSKLFEKLKKPLMEVFDWAVSMASPKGYEAGKRFGEEFARGSKEAIEAAEKSDKEKPKEKEEEQPKSEGEQKASIGVTIAQKSGWTDFDEGRKKRKKGRELTSRNLKAKNAREKYAEAATKYQDVASNYGENTEEYKKAYAELTEAQKECAENADLTKQELDEMATIGKEGTEQMATGFAKMGEAAIGAGVGISMLGGLLSSLGLEELGEGVSWFGNMITMAGTAVTAIIPIIKLLSTTLVTGGVSSQAAWWWAILIVAAVAALVVGIIAIANAVKNASPEAKLERAQEAADKAADAADRATESYENLKNAFEGLENGYKALDDLTKGTEEWNNAINDINNSVLDLIAQYPALAALVENEGGVLTIDINSDEAQAILNEAKESAIIARNNSNIAALEVAKAEDEVAYKNLNSGAKIGGDSAVAGGWVVGSTLALEATALGTIIGSAIAPGIGTAIGAGVGALVGIAGGIFAGMAATEEEMERNQGETEALAKAIASGAIVDDGSGYQVKDRAKLAELGIKEDKLDEFYAEVGDSTAELREFGNQLLETEKQSEAAFDALAVSAMQLANTLGFTEEEQTQATNIVDNATTERFYNQALKDMGDHDFTSNKLDENQKKKRDEAIRAQYGADARIDGNKVIYRDAEGKQQTEELTSDEMKAITANYIATNKAAEAIERTPAVLDKVGKELGFAKDSAEREAFEAATTDKSGKNLTKDQAETMAALTEEQLLGVWMTMDLKDQEIFGSFFDFVEKTKGAGDIAAAAFEDARISAEKTGAEIKAFMTSDMAKGFTKKMEEVFAIGGPEAVAQIQKAYDKLIEGQTDEVAQEITALMNGVDWTNQEELLAFQIELEEQYGYTREQAKEMTDAMAEATDATSSLTEAAKAFGKLYQITQKMNAAIEKASNLQWEYERLLNSGADATELSANIEQRRQALLDQGNHALEAYNQAIENMHEIYTSGYSVAGKDLTNYVKFDQDTGQYDVSELQRQIDAGMFGGEDSDGRKAVEDYVSKLEEANETAKDQLDTAKDAYEQLEELNQAADEAYNSLYEQVGEAITSTMEKSISVQEEILNATETANEKMVSAIQEQINADRQARQNEKTEENIDKLRQQQAYLGMDTSGANSLQLAELDKQIEEEEQAYQDTLIDQSLQQLQDANNQAAQQRERQIALAEAQLEAYKMSDQYQIDTQSKLDAYLAEYRAHEQAVRAYEQNQALREEYANMTAEKQVQAQDAYKLSFDEYKTKYGKDIQREWEASEDYRGSFEEYRKNHENATEEEWKASEDYRTKFETYQEDNYTKFGEIGTAMNTEVAKPGPWDPEQDELGKAFIEAGFLDGMSDAEKLTFWKQLSDNTALAATSTKVTGENTEGVGDEDMAELLDGIKQNTSAENLANIQLGSEYAGAKAKAQSFTAATGIKITDTSNKNEDGSINYSGSGTASYIATGNALSGYSADVTNKIKESNTRAKNGYSTKFTKDELTKNGIETQDAYYARLQKEGKFEKFLSDMATNGSSSLSYEQYINDKFKQVAQRQNGIVSTVSSLNNRNGGLRGMESIIGSDSYKTQLQEYIKTGGSEAEFKKELAAKVVSGAVSGVSVDNVEKTGKYDGIQYYRAYIHAEGMPGTAAIFGAPAPTSAKESISRMIPSPESKYMCMIKGEPYIYYDGQWRVFDKNPNSDVYWGGEFSNEEAYNHLKERYLNRLRKYKTGGIADFTGPAWLDGTPSKPEYVLNSAQTERFFSLIDVLEKYDADDSKKSSGDNYFDIEINVEKLENDYDVEKIANKIRSMIYNDATYRNVNAINHIR